MSQTFSAGGTAASQSVPHNLGEMVLAAAAVHYGTALRYRRDGAPVAVSYPELGRRVREIAAGLIALGIGPGDRVAIFAATCAEWTLADFGILCAGAVVTPVYHTNSAEECAYVLGHSGARAVFCGDAEQAGKVARTRGSCPDLEHLLSLSDDVPGTTTLSALMEGGRGVPAAAIDARLAGCGREDPATLVYTSGTTGPPKGCVLSHGSLLAAARAYAGELGIREGHSVYQFLPLAHVLARVAQAVAISSGATICVSAGDPQRLIAELSEFAPTHFPAVPRVYEKLHAAVIGRIQDGPALQRALFGWAVRCGARAGARERASAPRGVREAVEHRLADRLVLRRVRGLFGPGLELALVGAAAVAPELLQFFDACGVPVLEGYGLTESCAVATLNTPRGRRRATVGRALPGTEVAIGTDGEVLIRGPHLFSGYWRDPDATAAALTADGWLRTGDLGAISADGFVSITGRKKDLIITSSGKNITPVNIESELRETRYIAEAVLFGEGRPYLVAMLTLDRDEAARLAARLGVAPDPATIAADPRVREEIGREVAAVNDRHARIEQIKRFAILDHDLSQAAGELTPTLKVKRAFVYDRYRKLFDALYAEPEQTR